MNEVFLTGKLGQDPEHKKTGAGKSVCTFSIPTKIGEKVQWHKIVTWEAQADNCAQYLKKGSQVLVKGRIEYREYEKDGHKVKVTEIIARGVEFLSPPKDKGEANISAAPETAPLPSFEDFGDIPF